MLGYGKLDASQSQLSIAYCENSFSFEVIKYFKFNQSNPDTLPTLIDIQILHAFYDGIDWQTNIYESFREYCAA